VEDDSPRLLVKMSFDLPGGCALIRKQPVFRAMWLQSWLRFGLVSIWRIEVEKVEEELLTGRVSVDPRLF